MGRLRRCKNTKQPIIKQVLELVPRWLFDSCTNTFKTYKGCSKYKAYDQFIALIFGQFSQHHTLNDITTG